MKAGWRRPPALRPGDRVGVCAPAGRVDAAALAAGVREVRRLGFDVQWDAGILERTGFTAGSVERRLAELRSLFADDSVAAIFCARGGAGALHLLPLLEAHRIAQRPKILLGYSDITLLHQLFNRLCLTTFHGPLVARELAEGSYDQGSLVSALSGETLEFGSAHGLRALVRGDAEGVLRGGCLSLAMSLAGTPWALRFEEPTILFLEDVAEAPYRIDRQLRQARLSGALASVVGIVLGEMKDCEPAPDAGYSLEEIVLRALEGFGGPIAMGLRSGHTAGANLTLPLGVRARLSCGDEVRLETLEAATA